MDFQTIYEELDNINNDDIDWTDDKIDSLVNELNEGIFQSLKNKRLEKEKHKKEDQYADEVSNNAYDVISSKISAICSRYSHLAEAWFDNLIQKLFLKILNKFGINTLKEVLEETPFDNYIFSKSNYLKQGWVQDKIKNREPIVSINDAKVINSDLFKKVSGVNLSTSVVGA